VRHGDEACQELYGDRLVFTSCPKPENLTRGINTTLLGSDHQVLLLPASGKTAGLDVGVRRRSAYGDDAYESFDAACAAVGKQLQAVAGTHLVTLDCGTPVNVTAGGNVMTFGAKAHVEVTSGSASIAPVASRLRAALALLPLALATSVGCAVETTTSTDENVDPARLLVGLGNDVTSSEDYDPARAHAYSLGPSLDMREPARPLRP
jgi:hypothetical protein